MKVLLSNLIFELGPPSPQPPFFPLPFFSPAPLISTILGLLLNYINYVQIIYLSYIYYLSGYYMGHCIY